MFKRIVVGLDGSAISERSLNWVRLLRNRAEVVLVQCIEPPKTLVGPDAGIPEVVSPPTIDERLSEAEGYLLRVARENFPGAAVRVRIGPASELSEVVRETGADLIAIATRGGSKLQRRFIGGTTEELLTGSPVPVFVVPSDASEMPKPEGIRRIVVPLDGSENSESVLPLAEALARFNSAEITLAYALIGPEGEYRMYGERQGRLPTIAEGLERRGIKTRFIVQPGAPAPTILEIAEEVHADLLTLSTRGAGALGRAILGSTASEVIRRAHVPVLAGNHEALAAWSKAGASFAQGVKQ